MTVIDDFDRPEAENLAETWEEFNSPGFSLKISRPKENKLSNVKKHTITTTETFDAEGRLTERYTSEETEYETEKQPATLPQPWWQYPIVTNGSNSPAAGGLKH